MVSNEMQNLFNYVTISFYLPFSLKPAQSAFFEHVSCMSVEIPESNWREEARPMGKPTLPSV